jgi:hypothetical protein
MHSFNYILDRIQYSLNDDAADNINGTVTTNLSEFGCVAR